MLNCKFCQDEKKNPNSLRNHERLCKSNPNRQISTAERPGFHSNKRHGNQFTTGRILSHAASTIEKIRSSCIKTWSQEELRQKQSQHKKEIMPSVVLKFPDSYSSKNVCGRSKRIHFENECFHSSWELIVAKWLTSNNIKWERKVSPISYVWNGLNKLYFPDFYLPELDLFVEVKGYETERDRCKWNAVQNLVVLKKNEIKQIQLNQLSPGILRGRERLS
jgi:hypothetical protein